MTHMITCLFTSHRLPSTSAHRSQQAASANSAELGCGHKNGVMMMVIHANERRDPLERVRDESVPMGGHAGGVMRHALVALPTRQPLTPSACSPHYPPVECGFIQHVPPSASHGRSVERGPWGERARRASLPHPKLPVGTPSSRTR